MTVITDAPGAAGTFSKDFKLDLRLLDDPIEGTLHVSRDAAGKLTRFALQIKQPVAGQFSTQTALAETVRMLSNQIMARVRDGAFVIDVVKTMLPHQPSLPTWSTSDEDIPKVGCLEEYIGKRMELWLLSEEERQQL